MGVYYLLVRTVDFCRSLHVFEPSSIDLVVLIAAVDFVYQGLDLEPSGS